MSPQNFKTGGGIKQEVLEAYRVYPDVDYEDEAHFTCPRCGQEETWGETRIKIAKILHKRFPDGPRT